MEPAQILDELGVTGRMPVAAIRAADADRAAVLPLFLQAVEQCCREDAAPSTQDAVFFIFHLLGQWRETQAYRPLALLLRRPSGELEDLLGDAITETSARVMAAVCDGDPKPLYEVILDPEADEFARSAMCEALAMAALRGALPREEAARFLRACYGELKPQGECPVWDGWQSAIARLGLVELKSHVAEAFRRGYISDTWLAFKDFEGELQRAIDDPQSWAADPRCGLPGDTIEELSTWSAFRPQDKTWTDDDEWKEADLAAWSPSLWSAAPAVNAFKGVGRNDPCPCGSGKKFKKCCLGLKQETFAEL